MIENYQDNTLRIFNLNASRPLAEKIATSVGTELGRNTVRQFGDGKIQINIEENICGDHVYIIQATNASANDHLMELLILIDALKRASAKAINVILPYYGYARQDHTVKPREPITAKLVVNMLIETGATCLLASDSHTVQIQGFFDILVDNLFTAPLFAHYYRQQTLVREEIVVVPPKNSGAQRACSLSEYLDATLTIVGHEEIDRARQEGYVIGNVAGKECILVDDTLSTGQTLITAAGVLMKNGAQEVHAYASHGLLSEGTKATLENTPIKEVSITNSIYTTAGRQPATLNAIFCVKLMGGALLRIYRNKPMSPLFRLEPKGE